MNGSPGPGEWQHGRMVKQSDARVPSLTLPPQDAVTSYKFLTDANPCTLYIVNKFILGSVLF